MEPKTAAGANQFRGDMSANSSSVPSSSNGGRSGSPNGNGLAEARQREMVADLCRYMGQQLTGKAQSAQTPINRICSLAGVADLPPRVRQTLERLLAGDSEKQIARRLGLSPHTIHIYVKTLYRRFEACTRGELIARLIGTFDSPP
jgi:DNA-binding NarL/FixJ family response regulator